MSKTAHAVEREYQVLAALADIDVPTPKVYCLCQDNEVLGTPFYVSLQVVLIIDYGVFKRTYFHGSKFAGHATRGTK